MRSSLVPSVLNECVEKGVKGAVLITAGFKEIKTEVGTNLQDGIATIANQANIKIIGPNTFGMVNLQANLNVSFTLESVVCCFPSPKTIWAEEKHQLIESGVAIYPTPERAAKALAGLVKQRR